MADEVFTTATTTSVYKTSVGQPKKFSQSWRSVMKRIYVSEEVLLELNELKNWVILIVMIRPFFIC